jgi:hypothetical protein
MGRVWISVVLVLTSLVLGCGDEAECPSGCPGTPIIFPGIEVAADSTVATLAFTVDARGGETLCRCEYTRSTGRWSVSDSTLAGAGWGPQQMTLRLTPLEPEAWYFYRLTAINCAGSVSTEVDSFQTRRVNLLPDTFVTVGPLASGPGGGSSIHLYWFGVDADGTIDHFEWMTSDSDPAGAWHWTMRTDSTFVLEVSLSSEWVFWVRAVDNDGGVDPSPAYYAVPIGPRIGSAW